MSLVITLLILLLVVVISFYIVEQLGLPGKIGWAVKLILGVIFLLILFRQLGVL